MLVFAGVMLAMLLAALDQTIVATALPRIALDLHGIQHYAWAVFASASIIGPLLGGYLTDSVSWRWIFYINLPLGAAALLVIGTRMILPFHKREHQIDYLGAGILTAAVVSFLMVAIWGGT